MFWKPMLLNLQRYNHSSLSYNHIQVYRGKQSLGFLFSNKFPVFRWKLQYYYFIASSACIHTHFFKWRFYKNFTARERTKHWMQLNLDLFKYFLAIVYFIWCMMGYTVRQILGPHNVTRSTKLRGAQRASELTLRSMEFGSLENLIFPALVNFKFIYIYINEPIYHKWTGYNQ